MDGAFPTIDLDALHALATQAREQAYAPYSRLHVGAALLTARGGSYSGCNVENASFSCTGCAEQHAIAAAVLAEGPDMRIVAVVISACNDRGESLGIPPCGACRQRIIQFGPHAEVAFRGGSGKLERVAIGELLPSTFELSPEA